MEHDDFLDRALAWHDRHPRFMSAFVIVMFTIMFILILEAMR
jgi:hypothetical protein